VIRLKFDCAIFWSFYGFYIKRDDYINLLLTDSYAGNYPDFKFNRHGCYFKLSSNGICS